MTAHFPASIDLPNVLETVRAVFPEHEIPSSVEYVPDQDWVIHVQSTWKPIVVGSSGDEDDKKNTQHQRFVLTFPWHTADDVEEAIQRVNEENNNNSQGNSAQTY